MLSRIETLGPELLRKIASSCDKKTLDAFASTSSYIRLLLIDVIHKRVEFRDQPEVISQKLGVFLNVLTIPSRIMPYSTVRSASFTIEYSFVHKQAWKTTFSDPLPVATCLPLQIFDSIRVMHNLQSLTLKLYWLSKRQESFFYGLLKDIEIQAKHIRIHASDRITRRVLEKSPQLRALELPQRINVVRLLPLVGGLRRLVAGVDCVESGGPIQFPTVNEVNLTKITGRCENLEELVLKTYFYLEEDHPFKHEDVRSAFQKDFAKAIIIFKSMTSLKRLAITIDVETANSFGHDVGEEDVFYTSRLLWMSTSLPGLVQIGIINDLNEYWTLTKAHSGRLTFDRGILSSKVVGFPDSIGEGFY